MATGYIGLLAAVNPWGMLNKDGLHVVFPSHWLFSINLLRRDLQVLS